MSLLISRKSLPTHTLINVSTHTLAYAEKWSNFRFLFRGLSLCWLPLLWRSVSAIWRNVNKVIKVIKFVLMLPYGTPSTAARILLQWKGDNYAYLIIYYGHFDVRFFLSMLPLQSDSLPLACSLFLCNCRLICLWHEIVAFITCLSRSSVVFPSCYFLSVFAFAKPLVCLFTVLAKLWEYPLKIALKFV